jgi:hypothetical protein
MKKMPQFQNQKLYFLFLATFLIAKTANCQTTTINLNIFDEFNSPISNCNIKISGTKSKLIYSYFNTGDKNSFSKTISSNNKDDSLAITISKLTYRDTTLVIKTSVQKQTFIIKLKVRTNLLNSVDINGPPIWKLGDTTNFKVDAFKEGDEKKLKDIIEKLPGFEITEDGQLIYNQKPINRIRIDNEDLFAEKIKLLLNSFPVHVINLLQVQQNQSVNKLLNGLEGDETFINLTLKKRTLKAGFGDFEAGLGTKGRYLASPVLFTITNNLKAGYIGNLNSIGNNSNTDYEIKNEDERSAGSLLMANYPLLTINNVPNLYYIRNNLLDNRADINTKLSKKLHSKTELLYSTDNQQQSTTNNNNYYNGQYYIQRIENNYGKYKPRLFNIKQNFKYDIDSTSQLETIIGFFGDYTKGLQKSNYYQGNEIIAIRNTGLNLWNSFNINSVYTKRTGFSTANQTTLNFNTQIIRQNTNALSPQWASIYNLPDADYVLLNQYLNNRYTTLSINHHRYITLKKQKLNWNLAYKFNQMNLANELTFKDTLNLGKNIKGINFGNNNNYQQHNILSSINGFLFNKKDGSKISYDLRTGLTRTLVNEQGLKNEFNTLVASANVMYFANLFKYTSNVLNISFTQNALDFTTNVPSVYQPKSIENYNRTIAQNYALKYFTINNTTGFLWHNSSAQSSLNFSYTHAFNNFVHLNLYKNFLNLSTDSLVTAGTNNLSLSANHRIVSLLLNALIEIKAFTTSSTFLFLNENNIYKSINNSASLQISLKKNWNKKYYITLSSRYDIQKNKLPADIISQNIQSKSGNLISGIKQRFLFFKGFNFILDTKHIYNNMHTSFLKDFLFIDAETNFKLPKTPLNFTIRAENFINVNNYSVTYNYVDRQLISSIPLIGRNIFASIRYEL